MTAHNDLLTVPEVAGLLRIKESTVYAWSETGVLPCYRLGRLLRFDRKALAAWLRVRATGGARDPDSDEEEWMEN